jgi:hypothetical protein
MNGLMNSKRNLVDLYVIAKKTLYNRFLGAGVVGIAALCHQCISEYHSITFVLVYPIIPVLTPWISFHWPRMLITFCVSVVDGWIYAVVTNL